MTCIPNTQTPKTPISKSSLLIAHQAQTPSMRALFPSISTTVASIKLAATTLVLSHLPTIAAQNSTDTSGSTNEERCNRSVPARTGMTLCSLSEVAVLGGVFATVFVCACIGKGLKMWCQNRNATENPASAPLLNINTLSSTPGPQESNSGQPAGGINFV